MKIADRTFEGHTYVMAIINLTPDSFYAASRATRDDVLFRAERAVKEGADALDIGAQSTRPGHSEISAEEELSRLEGPLSALRREFDVPLSVDTFYASCAKAALELGADMINDVWGLSRDEDMAATIARFNASVCIMHNARTPIRGDIFPPVLRFLRDAALRAESAGIARDRICMDGGIGFAKDAARSLELLENYQRLSSLGYPLLLGCSRKSLFGGRAEDRLPATLAATRRAVRQGVLFVRVHDVKQNVQVIREECGL